MLLGCSSLKHLKWDNVQKTFSVSYVRVHMDN
jgi:hypothetical protein